MQTERRLLELQNMGINVKLVCIGRKGEQYFKRRPQYNMASECAGRQHGGHTQPPLAFKRAVGLWGKEGQSGLQHLATQMQR